MIVMVVDNDRSAMQKIALFLTSRQLAMTVVLKQTLDTAVEYTMCHAVDRIYVRTGLVGKLYNEFVDTIRKLQPITTVYLLEDNEEITVTPLGDIVKKTASLNA